MILLILLSFYQVSWGSNNYKHFSTYKSLKYGFKKNANVFINISNATSQMVFGLATKKEIKKLESLKTCIQYCDGKDQVSKIQFSISNFTSSSSFNFIIPSKNILTPYSIACEQLYKFTIYLNIINGPNHLDYRHQNLMNCLLALFILFLVITIFILIYYLKTKTKSFSYNFFLILFFLLTSIQFLYRYILYIKYKNYEFIRTNKDMESVSAIIPYFVICCCCILNQYRYEDIRTFSNPGKNPYFLFIIAFFTGCYIIILLLCFSIPNNTFLYFIMTAFYLIFVIVNATIPSPYSLTKFAIIIILLTGYFVTIHYSLTLLLNFNYLGRFIMTFNLIYCILFTISGILILIDHIFIYSRNNIKNLHDLNDFEQIENYPNDSQQNNITIC